MRLAISNIAWDIAEDEAIADLLSKKGVDAIDVAPGKYFPDPSRATAAEVAVVKRWWSGRGVEITGMQSLLFGTTGLNVFGSQESQSAMLLHLGAVCRIAGGLGATRLVFGSPKNRDRSGLDDSSALQMATAFFHRLGDIALSQGVTICLEPNPQRYGANFMTTSLETASVVGCISHPAIRMQLDTGAIALNGESADVILQQSASLVGHIHASEPDLLPLGDGGCDHVSIHAALKKYLPNHVVSIEMVATKDEPHMSSISRAIDKAALYYGAKSRDSFQ